jgi:hypothetical protein
MQFNWRAFDRDMHYNPLDAVKHWILGFNSEPLDPTGGGRSLF